jgi:hypothetical protein
VNEWPFLIRFLIRFANGRFFFAAVHTRVDLNGLATILFPLSGGIRVVIGSKLVEIELDLRLSSRF